MAQNTLEIVAKVKADTAEASKQLQQLMQQFQGFKLNDSALTSQIERSFAKLEKAIANTNQTADQIAGGKATVTQLNAMTKASEQTRKAFGELQQVLAKVGGKQLDVDLNSDEIINAKRLAANAEKAVKDAQDKLKSSLEGLSLPSKVNTKLFTGLLNAVDEGDIDKIKTAYDKLGNELITKIKDVNNKIADAEEKRTANKTKYESQQTSLTSITEEIKKYKEAENELSKFSFKSFSESLTSATKGTGIVKLKSSLSAVNEAFQNIGKGGSTDAAIQALQKLQQQYNSMSMPPQMGAEQWTQLGEAINSALSDSGNITQYIQKLNDAKQKLTDLTKGLGTSFDQAFTKQIQGYVKNGEIDKLSLTISERLTDIQNKLSQVGNNADTSGLEAQRTALENFQKALNNLINTGSLDALKQLQKAWADAQTKASGAENNAIQEVFQQFLRLRGAVDGAADAYRGASSASDAATDSIIRQRQELGQVISRFAQFGTMTGIIRTFSRVVRSAFQSVKELDEAMNNIAVVTDYTTADLWNQIDAYTAMAQATGSTIKGSYEVAQLYYQQGLTDAEVKAAATETLKMARISNIDYAKATDYATAAVKGFGLAYQDLAHINDVYSNLAAKTAADTKEISIAMSKVASIAHSTGMELETTAAFLTQIIATTREAPETAGTALKTVIARFAEVKKLISQGEDTGTDEEGTEIDVNNIETALKTAGVALRDTTGQMRDLDDVFIELASRWDSLDTMQQRYIATQAAGSRQQSRFLAMMNDYEGLQKTLGYAMDSAGASQEQFNKTLDSLQSKLNNLSNAWTEFSTGIMDSDFIKGGVDILTKVLDTINDITGALGSSGSAISKGLLTFSALRYGTGAAGSLLGKMGVPTNLPTLSDQWNNGALGSIISGISTVKQGYLPAGDIAKLNQIASLQNNIKTWKEALSGLDAATPAAKAFTQQIAQAEASVTALSGSMAGMSNSFWGVLSPMAKITIAITAIIAVITILDKVIKTTKERAKEFDDTLSSLQNINSEISSLKTNLSELQSYWDGVKDSAGKVVDGMDDFTTLQKGVGSYGQNISLTNEQYSRYLEICDAIVALNPDIAKGYDSNAEAIARNGSALDDLIAKQEQQIRNKAIQISVDMDTEFYKDASAKAQQTQQEINETEQKIKELNNVTVSSAGIGGNPFHVYEWDGLINSQQQEALYKILDNKNANMEDKIQFKTLQEVYESSNDIIKAINDSEFDSSDQKLALAGLTKLTDYYSTSVTELNERLELSNEELKQQKDNIKEQWVAMLPGIDGWYELSDAQQAFVEKYVRGLDIDLTNANSMESQEQEIKNRVRQIQEIFDGESVELKVTLPGADEKTWLLTDIIETLGSGKFEELGMEAGLAWLDSFYQAILGITDPKVQNALMTALGFDGSWEDFGKLGASGFAEQIYGSSYTDRVANMQKFATERTEAEYGREASPQDFEAEYSDWYNWLIKQSGETADTIMNHYSELVVALNNEGKKVTKETLEKAAKEYLDAITNVEEMIKKATEAGLNEDNIKTVKEYYDDLYKDKEVGSSLTTEVAINAVSQKEAIDEMASSYENWINLLENAGDDIDHLTTDQILAFDEMSDALRKLFELSKDFKISKDILKSPEVFDLMQKAAEGDVDAIEKLGDIISEDLGKSINQTAKELNEANKETENYTPIIENLAEGMDLLGETMKTGEYLSFADMDQGMQDTISGFQTLLDAGVATVDQVQAYASAHGIVLDIKESDAEMEDVKGNIKYEASGVTTLMGQAYESKMTMTGTSSVPMPKIVGASKTGSSGGMKLSSGGGGGGGSKTPAKPKQDPFYNYIKTVDDYKKRLESLQDVQELLTKPIDIFNNTKSQEDYYKTLLGSNQSYLNHVNSELERLQKEAQSKYAKYIEVSIDGSLRLTEEYWASTGDITEELDEWIDAYDDVLGRQKDLTDEINDYKKELKDLWEGWRDSFIDLTNDIADVFQELDEKQLEDRQEFYEKLEEQDQRYLESVRNNIEEERKARERANSFEDLQKKQSRLALLQRDSSGRYANDIAELQEEINSDQQDLADENVDNILDTLEKQMDKDAERHQDILNAMQKQIDSNVENRIYIERAEQTIAQGEQAILDAIHMGENWRNASNAEREKMDEEQATNIAGSKSYLEKLNEGITSSSEYISKMVTDALTKQTESLIWTIGDIPQNDEAHVAHAMETTLPSILEQFFARTTTAQDMADDNKVSGARYASGGLVDYTGPAWVDGTPGKPEAFLNANQTAMIASFTANLAKMISGKFPSSNVEAGSNCEINIDIGSIGADYDIDQAINKVKQEIVNSAQFRNVTLLNRRR